MNQSSSQRPATLEELKSLYKAANEELIRENSLIHDRMNVFLTAQAFLLAAIGLTVEKGWTAEAKVIAKTVIFIGIGASLFTIISIFAAIYVFFRFFNNIKDKILPGLREYEPLSYGVERQTWEIWMGFSSAVGIPLILLAAWLFLALRPEFRS
jgi:hypothetical protein